MKWLTGSIFCVLGLSASTAWAATLTWNANNEADLAGYRIYQCSGIPCGLGSGNHSLYATTGKVTSFDIGTPAVTHHYFITAFDVVNNESLASNVVTFTPGTPIPRSVPALKTVTFTLFGNPITGPWGVNGITSDLRDVMVKIYLDGEEHHIEHSAPYSFPDEKGGTFGIGWHSVEFVFYLEGTTTEIGRFSTRVKEGNVPPITTQARTVTLTLFGNPATGPWGVNATTTDLRDVMVTMYFDGQEHHIDHAAPYSFPSELAGTFGDGSHFLQFHFYLEGTTTEIGRFSARIIEGS